MMQFQDERLAAAAISLTPMTRWDNDDYKDYQNDDEYKDNYNDDDYKDDNNGDGNDDDIRYTGAHIHIIPIQRSIM